MKLVPLQQPACCPCQATAHPILQEASALQPINFYSTRFSGTYEALHVHCIMKHPTFDEVGLSTARNKNRNVREPCLSSSCSAQYTQHAANRANPHFLQEHHVGEKLREPILSTLAKAIWNSGAQYVHKYRDACYVRQSAARQHTVVHICVLEM